MWALDLLLVTILNARFCSLVNLLHSKPQHVILNCMCDRIGESYISFIREKGKYLFLFAAYFLAQFQQLLQGQQRQCCRDNRHHYTVCCGNDIFREDSHIGRAVKNYIVVLVGQWHQQRSEHLPLLFFSFVY